MKILFLRRVVIGEAQGVLAKEDDLPLVVPGMHYFAHESNSVGSVEHLYCDGENSCYVAVLKRLVYDTETVQDILAEHGVEGLQRQLKSEAQGWELRDFSDWPKFCFA